MLLSRCYVRNFLRGARRLSYARHVPAAKNFVPFESPPLNYTPFSVGGTIGGHVATGWESVEEAFADNFAEGTECGAQLAIIVDGETVVDLHGASASCTTSRGPYDGDTMQNLFSAGKQIEALAVAMLADRGNLKYSDLVTKHWPEFGQGGKENITVADVMRHAGGVPWFLKPELMEPGDSGEGHRRSAFNIYGLEEVNDTQRIDKIIELSPRVDYRGTQRNYHACTRGFIVDGIIRRADCQGRGLEAFVNEEICAPLGVMHYRLSVPVSEQDQFNWADICPAPPLYAAKMVVGPALLNPKIVGRPDVKSRTENFMTPGNPMAVASSGFDVTKNPKTHKFDPTMTSLPEVRAAVMSSDLISSSARAQAAIFRNFAEGGGKLLSPDGVVQALAEPVTALDGYFNEKSTFTQCGMARIADSARAFPKLAEAMEGFFGWRGLGGHINLVDPQRKVTFVYSMTGLDVGAWGDPRAHRLFEAYQTSIKK